MTEITYSFDLTGIDWAALKDTLAADDFDNGRTPEQYRLSAENSALNCFAWAGNRIIGTVRALSDGVGNAYIVDVWTQSQFRQQGIARQMMELTLEKLPGQHVYLFTDDEAVGFYRKSAVKPQPSGLGIEGVRTGLSSTFGLSFPSIRLDKHYTSLSWDGSGKSPARRTFTTE